MGQRGTGSRRKGGTGVEKTKPRRVTETQRKSEGPGRWSSVENKRDLRVAENTQRCVQRQCEDFEASVADKSDPLLVCSFVFSIQKY